jgi:hypothetical protein
MRFDYSKQDMYVEKENKGKIIYSNHMKSNKKINDGLSLFFLARQMCNIKQVMSIPTLLDKDIVTTTINFQKKNENIEIDAVNYPIKTLYFNGVANWTGIYGITGKFEGWFSDDEARIPIKAKMKVYVGDVNIELIKWKRTSWNPPKGN